jgi:hypothetical protein
MSDIGRAQLVALFNLHFLINAREGIATNLL